MRFPPGTVEALLAFFLTNVGGKPLRRGTANIRGFLLRSSQHLTLEKVQLTKELQGMKHSHYNVMATLPELLTIQVG